MKFIHVVAYSCRLFSLIPGKYFIVWIYHNLFTHSTLDGYLSNFQLLTIMSNIAMSILMPFFWWVYVCISVEIYLGMKLLGMGYAYLSRYCQFPKYLNQFILLLERYECSICSVFLPRFDVFLILAILMGSMLFCKSDWCHLLLSGHQWLPIEFKTKPRHLNVALPTFSNVISYHSFSFLQWSFPS